MKINDLCDLNGSKVLITGGLGFVGNNLARFIICNFNCDVTIVDDCRNSNLAIIDDIMDRVTFKHLSVLDPQFLDLLPNFDFIFHLACIQIAASSANPEEDLNVNALSTLRILQYLNDNNVKLKRFVYTSSGSVYGACSSLPIKEIDPINPLSFYAATKFLGEQYTIIYGRNYNLPVVAVRYSNVYGYGQSPMNPYCGVLGRFIHNAIENIPLTIIGDGQQTRDYTFITDAIYATLLCATSPRTIGDVFNIGTGVETSVNHLVNVISKLNNIQVLNIPERDIDNIRKRSLSVSKLQLVTGWSPEVNIEKGIELTYRWYSDFIKNSKLNG